MDEPGYLSTSTHRGGLVMGLSTEEVARMCHEANRSYCISIGDTSQPSWDDAPDWQKESARIGVTAHLASPGMTAEQSHESWLETKRADGWSYGPKKDPENKRHPCFLPYKELPEEQRIKDHIFKAVVHACVSVFGVGKFRR